MLKYGHTYFTTLPWAFIIKGDMVYINKQYKYLLYSTLLSQACRKTIQFGGLPLKLPSKISHHMANAVNMRSIVSTMTCIENSNSYTVIFTMKDLSEAIGPVGCQFNNKTVPVD